LFRLTYVRGAWATEVSHKPNDPGEEALWISLGHRTWSDALQTCEKYFKDLPKPKVLEEPKNPETVMIPTTLGAPITLLLNSEGLWEGDAGSRLRWRPSTKQDIASQLTATKMGREYKVRYLGQDRWAATVDVKDGLDPVKTFDLLISDFRSTVLACETHNRGFDR
jgi:hypothetical protein